MYITILRCLILNSIPYPFLLILTMNKWRDLQGIKESLTKYLQEMMKKCSVEIANCDDEINTYKISARDASFVRKLCFKAFLKWHVHAEVPRLRI